MTPTTAEIDADKTEKKTGSGEPVFRAEGENQGVTTITPL